MKQEDIIRMAREADPKANLSEPYCLDHETRAWLERFAAIVAAAATEAANARANTSWALMCKKMVAAENEACAKVCEDLYKKWVDDLVNDTDDTADSGTPDCVDCAVAIRARGNT